MKESETTEHSPMTFPTPPIPPNSDEHEIRSSKVQNGEFPVRSSNYYPSFSVVVIDRSASAEESAAGKLNASERSPRHFVFPDHFPRQVMSTSGIERAEAFLNLSTAFGLPQNYPSTTFGIHNVGTVVRCDDCFAEALDLDVGIRFGIPARDFRFDWIIPRNEVVEYFMC